MLMVYDDLGFTIKDIPAEDTRVGSNPRPYRWTLDPRTSNRRDMPLHRGVNESAFGNEVYTRALIALGEGENE